MSLHLKTLDADELHRFAEKCVHGVLPVERLASRRSYVELVRGRQFFVEEPLVDLIVHQKSFSAAPRWGRNRIMHLVLGLPDPSSHIRIHDVDNPAQSMQFEIYPGRVDPVLVHVGNVSEGLAGDTVVYDPRPHHLALLNRVIEKIDGSV